MVRLVHLYIAEKGFDHILTVVESALHREIVHVGIQHGGHLRFLDGTDFSFREHDEDADVFLATETVNGGTARVAARGTDDGQVVSMVAGLELRVLSNKEELKQVTEELESDVFERKGRAVEQLEEVKVFRSIERDEWSRGWMAESRIAGVNYGFELAVGDFFGVNVQPHDLEGQVGEGKVFPLEVVRADIGHCLWVEETAIRGKPFEDHVLEREVLLCGVIMVASA